MKYSLHMGVAALALSFAGAGVAADITTMKPATPGAASSPFATLDANKDGRLSQAEVRSNADLNSRFATLDSDSDTYLSQLEYGKWEGMSHSSVPAPGDRAPAGDPSRTGKPTDPSSPGTGIGNNGTAEKAPQ
jgi:hypothetical protein